MSGCGVRRLEATVAEWLDAQGPIWKHEGPAYGSEDGQYLPDFQLTGLLTRAVRTPSTSM
jgi:hypothetical protein